MSSAALTIFTDGGSRGNPGPAACAYVIQSLSGEIVATGSKFLGQTTNNVAEYQGLLLAIDWLEKHYPQHPLSGVLFKLDSLLIVNQLKGLYKVKEPFLSTLYQQALSRLNQLPFTYTLQHIPRNLNFQADLLVNQTLDNLAN